MPLIRSLSVSALLLLISIQGYSQDNNWRLYPGEGSKPDTSLQQNDTSFHGTRYTLDDSLKAYIGLVDSLDLGHLKPQGFRIQIYSASGPESRNNAYEQQSEFLVQYPNVKSYTLWNYPNWVVRIGDFRTRLEALEYHMELRALYPASFILRDEISIEKSRKK